MAPGDRSFFMAAAATDYFIKVTPTFSTTIASPGVASDSTTTFPLTSVAGLPTDTGIELVINRVTTADPDTPTNNYETIRGVVSGSNIINCVRGVEGTAQGWAAGVVVEYLATGDIQNRMVTGILVEHNQDGTHKETALDSIITGTEAQGDVIYHNGTVWSRLAAGTSGYFLKTQGAGANPTWAVAGIITTAQYAPQGFLINGKIVPSVASDNLTVAIKGMDGNDPSASNPVYCRIGDTVRTITAALSVTKNAGTNWFNSGSSELATKEIDYFVYLGYNSTDGVVVGFARYPGASQYDEFSATTTNEKYCAISTITNAAAGDDYELIGRFAATLSAGAGYTWTVPTFTTINLKQYPVFESRWLDILPTLAVSGGTVPDYADSGYKYKINRNTVQYVLNLKNSSGGTAGNGTAQITFQLPFNPAATIGDDSGGLGFGSVYESSGTIAGMYISKIDTNKAGGRNSASIATIVGNDQSSASRIYQAQGTYSI